jgi:hypothetical protein
MRENIYQTRRLAGACLGLGSDVPALQRLGQRLCLDRRTFIKTCGLDSLKDLFRNIQLFESHFFSIPQSTPIKQQKDKVLIESVKFLFPVSCIGAGEIRPPLEKYPLESSAPPYAASICLHCMNYVG